jgi:hypothetical protein
MEERCIYQHRQKKWKTAAKFLPENFHHYRKKTTALRSLKQLKIARLALTQK